MNLQSYVDLKRNPNIPDFRPGDSVRVSARVVEGDRQRIQAFEGVVIRIRRGGVNSTFTVRRVSHGVGVERVFPYYSPLVEKVEVVRVGRVRRAKLYYLRQRSGKAARIKPGSRARFEALTAGRGVPMVEEEEIEEEELATGEEVMEGDEAAEVEATDDAAEDAADEAPEAETAANTEPEAAEVAEEAPAAEDATEDRVAEDAIDAPVAEETPGEAAVEETVVEASEPVPEEEVPAEAEDKPA